MGTPPKLWDNYKGVMYTHWQYQKEKREKKKPKKIFEVIMAENFPD